MLGDLIGSEHRQECLKFEACKFWSGVTTKPGATVATRPFHSLRIGSIRVDDSVIQRILRHSTVATTQNHYIKTASPDAIAAMRQFSEALLCSTCAPDGDIKAKGSFQ